MRIGLLSSLSLALGTVWSLPAQASFDEQRCEAFWSVEGSLACNSVPFLAPRNDSRANLRLLLSDLGALPFDPPAVSQYDREDGYGPVPFNLTRLDPVLDREAPATAATPPVPTLDRQLAQLDITVDGGAVIAGDEFIEGEGSRCRSNNRDSASAFVEQLLQTPQLSREERQALAGSRLSMLSACTWNDEQLAALLPDDMTSDIGNAFVTYLRGATQFYGGHFSEATQTFASLAASEQPWLKETALYMNARIPLNAAQADAFDDMGLPNLEHVDNANLQLAEQGFERYLQTYPQGVYSASARGLMRRVHWLAGNDRQLADDYAWQLTRSTPAQRNKPLPDLVEEVQSKLLGTQSTDIRTPLLLAVNDLAAIAGYQTTFNLQQLQAQKAVFAEHPALYDYLQAAVHLVIEDNPQQVLGVLPAQVPDSLDYLAFSQQVLRGLAMHRQQDWNGAETLWLELLGKVRQPLQREQVELLLARNYELSQRLEKVFASDSPIKTAEVRLRLQRLAADAPLLRQQVTRGVDATERDSALFVLLYKELSRGRYAAFVEDFKLMPATAPEQPLDIGLGHFKNAGRTLSLFQWTGDKAESGYACPGIAEIAATLQADAKSPRGLNCLGEFILRNDLDHSQLDAKPYPTELGSSGEPLKGELFARHEGYRLVIGNQNADKQDRAYALFRAIKCYAPSGNNSCGGNDVEPAVRKAWFRQIKGSYADTPWSQSLQYYW